MMNIPTVLTLLRIALIPVFVAAFYMPVSWANLATAALFVVAGKHKTAAQMVALALLLYRDPIAGLPVQTLGFALLYIAAGLTLWSMAVYLRAAWPTLMSRGDS